LPGPDALANADGTSLALRRRLAGIAMVFTGMLHFRH
jgi:AICAR transformylase/IMP cyclohydrolase PurH